MNSLAFKNRREFREWLTANALSDGGVWILFYKNNAAESIKANEALEEALCFGWIDGQMRSVDENAYMKYFKQRSSKSNWSEKNKCLAAKLESSGLMTGYGRAKIEEAKRNGCWDAPKKEALTDSRLDEFTDMLRPQTAAYENFIKMSPSARKTYAASGFSKYHFHRIFGSIMNETLYGYSVRQKLERAAGCLLFAPHKTITEIALDLGFNDPALQQCSPYSFSI